MGHKFAELAFTKTVKSVQEQQGTRKSYQRMEDKSEDTNHLLGANEAAFISARDSFYMATVSETGWPYVQHRGGPVGFVKILDEQTLGLADFRGNRQYVSVGNLMTNDRISLFFMDYPNRTRLKILGRVALADPSDAGVMSKLETPGYRGRAERGFVITIEGFDWNCPQHITRRYTLAEVEKSVSGLQQHIAKLEAELALLKGETQGVTA